MTTGLVAEYIAAGVGVLGLAGGILRYLLRISTAIESASRVAAATFNRLEEHVAESQRQHERLADRVDGHTTQLAVLESRMDRS